MTGQRVVAVALLVASLFVLGTLSASLGATVTATPNDAIDIDRTSMPFVDDGASDIAQSYEQATTGDVQRSASANADGSPSAMSSGSGENGASGGGGESPPRSASGATGDGSAGASGQRDQGQSGGQGSSVQRGAGQGPPGEPKESLWSLLGRLLAYFLKVVAVLAVLAAVVTIARRRERLLARVRAFAVRLGLLPAAGATAEAAMPDDAAAAETVVERAWGEMVAASPADPPESDTPRECARAVIDAGVEREPAEELTAMYERVRYGDSPITPDEASRALAHLREVAPGRRDVSADGTDGSLAGAFGANVLEAGEGRT